MSSGYRPSTPEDEAQIIDLLARAFAARPTAAFLQPELIRWKLWEPCSDWPEPRSWVTERDGRIIAHTSMWPVAVVTGEKVQRGLSTIDWAAAGGSAGAGVALLNRVLKAHDFSYCIGGTAMTQSILPRIGFQLVDEAVTWTRPLRPWKRLFQSPSAAVVKGLPGKLWWAQVPSKSVGRQWTAAEVKPGAWDTTVPVFERGAGFFDYLDRCPGARCLRFHILDGGRKAGFFALVAGRLQVRVAGIWLQEPTADNWRIAFNLAQTAALEKTDALEFIARSSTASSALGAAQAGMHVQKRSPVMVRRENEDVPPSLQNQLCDNDDVFLNLM